jgi:C_GCAxxG_C_C family probable redox protein
MTDPVNIANERFAGPYSCSQAVFSAYAPRFGITKEQAIKIASAFGGGIALQGHVCGAVTGALMVIGLANGTVDPEDKENIYRTGQEFIKRFEEQHDTVICRELTGYDFRVPGEFQAAKDQKLSTTLCPEFVKSAAELVSEFLDK